MAKDSFSDMLMSTTLKKPEPVEGEDTDDLDPRKLMPKSCHALDIERGGEPVESFQYMHLSRGRYSPGQFTVWFHDGNETWEITVSGRNLRDIFSRINDHCVRIIRRADRDDQDEKKPYIEAISISQVKK